MAILRVPRTYCGNAHIRNLRTFEKTRASPFSAGVPKLLRQGRSHCNVLGGLATRTIAETAVRKTKSEDDQGLLRREV